MKVEVTVTAYHWGWFEFRLARQPDPAVPITQSDLNQHVLEIHPSTPRYAEVINFDSMKGMGGNGGWYKCKPDPRSSMPPSALWPHGTCCNGGGSCSKPSENKHRHVLENANPKLIDNHRVFEVHSDPA